MHDAPAPRFTTEGMGILSLLRRIIPGSIAKKPKKSLIAVTNDACDKSFLVHSGIALLDSIRNELKGLILSYDRTEHSQMSAKLERKN
jgi:hypothetical protein